MLPRPPRLAFPYRHGDWHVAVRHRARTCALLEAALRSRARTWLDEPSCERVKASTGHRRLTGSQPPFPIDIYRSRTHTPTDNNRSLVEPPTTDRRTARVD